MKTIKFASDLTPKLIIKKKKCGQINFVNSNWFLKTAAFAGVFFAAFFSFVFINSKTGNEKIIAQAEVQKNSAMFSNDIKNLLSWLDLIRQNSWNNKPFLQPIAFYDFLKPNDIRGLRVPVTGAILPLAYPENMPNAERYYRNGKHEGVDFTAGEGTSVYASYWGKIVRLDKNYKELTKSQYEHLIEQATVALITPSNALDHLRGRQIWIDHGNEVITRYCHLSEINPNLVIGQVVNQGDFLGKAGKSGLVWTNFGPHLHFEIRIDNKFLGQGLDYQTVKELYSKAFAS